MSPRLPQREHLSFKGSTLAVRCTYCSEELATTDGLHCVYCGALLSDPLATTVFTRPIAKQDESQAVAIGVVALVATLLISRWLLVRLSKRQAEE